MSMQQCKNKNYFRLHGQRYQHNEEAGMRGHVLHRQRLQHHTGGWALEGLEKGGLFTSLKKRIGYVLKKTDGYVFKKTDWVL
jgi:hypothetical protein